MHRLWPAVFAFGLALLPLAQSHRTATAAGAMQIIIPEWLLQRPSAPQPGADTTAQALKTITVVSDNLTCKTIDLTGPEDRNEPGDKVLIIGSVEDAGICSGAGRQLFLFDGLGRELKYDTTMKPDAIEIIEDLSPKPPSQQTRGLIVGTISIEGRGRLQDDDGRLAASTIWLCPSNTSLPVLPLVNPPCSFADAKGGVFRAVRSAGPWFVGMPIHPEHLAGPHESIRVFRTGAPETMDVLRFYLPAGGVANLDLVLPSFYSDATPTPAAPRIPPPTLPAPAIGPPLVGDAGLKRSPQAP